jgi:hypothetical protein
MSDDDHLKSPEQLVREVDATEARWAREARAAERRRSERWIEVAVWTGIALAAGAGWLAYGFVANQLGWYGGGWISGCCPLVGLVAALAAVRALVRAVIGSALG